MLPGVPLDGRFDPFTALLWFVQAPLDEVVARRSGLTQQSGPLDELLPLLEPFAMPSNKVLWVSCGGDEWTAAITQGADLSYVASIAARLGTRVVRTSWSPNVPPVRFGDTALWVWDAIGGRSEQVRTLQASNQDTRWSWHDDGEPFEFEDPDRYDRRRIKDRFDLDELNRLCAGLGIHRSDASWYGPRAYLEVQDTTGWQPQRTMSSAQWQAVHRPT